MTNTLNSILNHRLLFLLPICIAGLFYYNAIPGDYVLDDGLVLNRNEYVKRGFGGIPDILTHDSFYGSVGKVANLNGGRYRPLSLITYAIEYQFYGLKPEYSRMVNVLLYMLTSALIFIFLNQFIFKQNRAATLIATLLFTVHPIHTEVVANIKSRDEILSFIFILLSLYYLFSFVRNKNPARHFILSLLFFTLALLSKENAIIFLVMIPLTLYLMLNVQDYRIINLSLPYWGIILLYLLARFSIVGFQQQEVRELMDNPYLLATTEQKYATIFLILLKYLKLFFIPYPLSYDYGYNEIPYTTFGDCRVLLSISIHIGLIVVCFFSFKKNPIYAWCILFHLCGIFIVSNFVINIGAPMGERFLYQSSFFLLIALVAVLSNLFKEISSFQVRAAIAGVILLPILLLSFKVTHARNKVWLVGTTLGLTDVKTVPNSARALAYAGINLSALQLDEKDSTIKIEMLHQAIDYLSRALEIHPNFGKASQSLGLCYFYLKDYQKAGDEWLRTQKMNVGIGENVTELLNSVAEIYFYYGMKAGANKNYSESILEFNRAIHYKPNYADAWYNKGGAFFTIQQYDSAKACFDRALQIKPGMPQALQGIQALVDHGLIKSKSN